MRNAILNVTTYRKQAFALGVLAMLTVALALGGAGSPVSAQEPDNTAHTIQVTGTGTASGSPDIAVIQLGVQLFETDLGAAVTNANETMDAVMAALQAQGIAPEDIRTSNFSIYQESGMPQPLGAEGAAENRYVVNNVVEVRVRDLDQISAVIQAALDAGANNVYGLTFGLDDPAALEAEARTQAVEDARARAEALAGAFGLAVGEPITIREGAADSLGGARMMEAALSVGGGPVISEGQLTVTMQVTVVFELVPAAGATS